MIVNRALPGVYSLCSEVTRARAMDLPMVALESAVITHGLPFPENLGLARDMENEARGQGATPATIAVLDGRICVGLNAVQLDRLARGQGLAKISSRDLASALVKGQTGGTTVAGTMAAAHPTGIRVFATGGIGGVHRRVDSAPASAFDISADLVELSRLPMIVVCAGAKAILDLRATLEVLETYAVPVVGFQTDEFPAFYSSSSGLPVSARADSPEEVAYIASVHWELGQRSAVLVAQPPPHDCALPSRTVEEAVARAVEEARRMKVRGQDVTPFLLKRVKVLTGGESLRANLALLLNNARLAAQIARYIHRGSNNMTA